MNLAVGIILGCCALSAFAQIPDADQLKCRLCKNALTLTDCSTETICDKRSEECYIDQVITTTFEIVFRGGCRARQQCSGSSPQIGKREADMHMDKRQTEGELIACSRCCDLENDCNRRLCGIQSTAVNQSQCYFCDSKNSDQGEVRNPKDCITFTTCDTNQACFAQNHYNPGAPMTFKYGCFSFAICKLMMQTAFEDLDRCLGQGGSNKDCAQDNNGVCNVCCRDGGCNYGDCHTTRVQLYNQWKQNKIFSLDSLTSTSQGTSPTKATTAATTVAPATTTPTTAAPITTTPTTAAPITTTPTTPPPAPTTPVTTPPATGTTVHSSTNVPSTNAG